MCVCVCVCVCVCENHLFRRTLPVRDSHGQWSICNDRSMNPVSTSPAKTQDRDNEDRTSTSHLDFVISIRMYRYRYVIFESQKKANHDSNVSISPKVNFPLLHTHAPQAPRVVSRNAPFPPYVHPTLIRTIAVPSSGDVII